jgi:hypothetical protein
VLTQWVDAYARERGLPRKRVRDWISYMFLGGQLERGSSAAEGPRFTIKGAVALETRLPLKARATRDIDLVVDVGAGPEESSGAEGFSVYLLLRTSRATERIGGSRTDGAAAHGGTEFWHHSVTAAISQFQKLKNPAAKCLRGLSFRHAPDRIRTCDLWLRRPTLYPAELRARTWEAE